MKKVFTFLAFLLISDALFAQATGTLDATFGANGRLTTSFSEKGSYPSDMLSQSDGKILLSPRYHFFGSVDKCDMGVARFNYDGTADTTFGINGKVTTKIGTKSSNTEAITLQQNGKIVLVGSTEDTSYALVRYHSNGVLDSTFGNNGKVISDFTRLTATYMSDIALQSDGKILIGGLHKINGNDEGRIVLVRYNANGSLDTTFNRTGKIIRQFVVGKGSGIRKINLQADGKIIACSSTYSFTNNTLEMDAQLIRFNVNGTIDSTFNFTGSRVIKDFDLSASKVLSNGKILVSGVSGLNDTEVLTLFQFNEDGSPDITFGINGKVMYLIRVGGGGSTCMTVQKDGKIVALILDNNFSNPNLILIRYNSDGRFDYTFGTNGVTITPALLPREAYGKLVIQEDAKILAMGVYLKPTNHFGVLLSRFNNSLSVGTQSTNKNTPLSIFPNPTTNVLNIDFKNPINDAVKLTITDISGRVVYLKNYDKGLISNNLQINSQDFTAGLYIVNIVWEKENISRIVSKL
jgi:uncharacterized delta-60 repeat protein